MAWLDDWVMVCVMQPPGAAGVRAVGGALTSQVTVVVPTGKNDPDGGVQVAVNFPGQLSVMVGAGYVTVAPH